MAFADFRDFPVWQKASEMICEVYRLTSEFPKNEQFILSSNMRRAANSVGHNIAEGYGRFERRDKTRFYKIARGSAYELISQISVAAKLGFLKENQNTVINRYTTIISELDKLIKTIECR